MRGLDNPAVGMSGWPDIGCGLAGPGTKNGMGVRPGMLVVISGRSRMGEGTTRRDERQRQIQHSDPEGHDGGGGFNRQSIHRSTIFPGYSSTLFEETCLPTDAHGCYTIIRFVHSSCRRPSGGGSDGGTTRRAWAVALDRRFFHQR